MVKDQFEFRDALCKDFRKVVLVEVFPRLLLISKLLDPPSDIIVPFSGW
jgi:hypothetical protein